MSLTHKQREAQAARMIKIAQAFRPKLMTLAVRAALGSAEALVTLHIRQHEIAPLDFSSADGDAAYAAYAAFSASLQRQ